ncbi:MAG: hypothetical protein HZA36_00340 [Parcubacteria group bacterium]|nr:hypothetical protein [Parcubacteria group bacterium]
MALNKSSHKVLLYSIIGVILVVVITAFFLVESPKKARFRKFDERRVQDLQTIQYQILEYWRTRGRLPQALTDLNDDLGGFRVPRDPATNAEYEYAVGDSESFSLCATFFLASDEEKNYLPPKAIAPHDDTRGNEVWGHGWGQTCYDRTIDKERYRPYQKIEGGK